MTRGEFLKSSGAAAVLSMIGEGFAADEKSVQTDYAALQREIDEVTPQDFKRYLSGEGAEQPALTRLDAAFDRLAEDVRKVSVEDRPAVWLLYNMGVIVKSRQSCFSIDLMHRKATEIAPLLDFALITHNHGDHYTEEFYRAMNGAGKTVISNFKDNYGTQRTKAVGGYTRAEKTFKLKDVEIRTALTDHNPYLIDFTTAFEIRIGKFTIYHTGDCHNLNKLNPARRPDLWIVHPYCGMKVADGVRKLHPKLTAIAHLNELGHARDRYRWTYQDGIKASEQAKAVGGSTVVPTWGSRIF